MVRRSKSPPNLPTNCLPQGRFFLRTFLTGVLSAEDSGAFLLSYEYAFVPTRMYSLVVDLAISDLSVSGPGWSEALHDHAGVRYPGRNRFRLPS